MNYYIGQIFENEYPSEAADFCNQSQGSDAACYIKEIEPHGEIRRFQIVENEKESEEDIKKRRIVELESYLSSTDWYAVRYAETGVAIPDEIKVKRQSAREEISSLREEIKPEEE